MPDPHGRCNIWMLTANITTYHTSQEKGHLVNNSGVASGWAEIGTTHSAHRCRCSGVAELLTSLHLCSTWWNNLWPHRLMMLTAGWGMASVRRLYWPPSCGSLVTKDILHSTSTHMCEEEPTYPNIARNVHTGVSIYICTCLHTITYTQVGL